MTTKTGIPKGGGSPHGPTPTSNIRLLPKVEVELKDIALRLVAAGIGDTYLPSAYTRAPYYPTGLSTAPFSPALHDTFAIITRPGARLTPGVHELLGLLEAHMRTVADELMELAALEPARENGVPPVPDWTVRRRRAR